MIDYVEIFKIIGENFNIFEHHGVDKMCTCDGVSVSPDYSGLGICEQIYVGRERMCEEYGIELTTGEFTSDFSARAVEKLGYKTDKELR